MIEVTAATIEGSRVRLEAIDVNPGGMQVRSTAAERADTVDRFGASKSVLDRLIEAADVALSERDIATVTIDSVAEAAGVSRATAFRQLGGRDHMIVLVALVRSERFAARCREIMSEATGVFAQLEAAVEYLVAELPGDPVIQTLFEMRSTVARDPDVHALASSTIGPALLRGQQSGELRTDLPLDELIVWTVEQLFLAVDDPDRSAQAVRHRMRKFVVPALEARRPDGGSGGGMRSHIAHLEKALTATKLAFDALQESVL